MGKTEISLGEGLFINRESLTPLISIIVPVFNASQFLAHCLDSISGQTFKDFEVILVDDGSTDNSAEIYSLFAQKDSRLQLYRQPNKGVSAARNLGLEKAQGEWVCFVDSDDALPQDALQAFLDRAVSGNYDLIIGGYEDFNSKGQKTYWVEERVTIDLDRDAAIAQMYEPSYFRYLGYVWGKLFKSSIIRDHNLQFNPQIVFNEDRLFTTQYLSFSKQICFFTSTVYYYFEHSASAMASLYAGFNKKFITDFDAMILMRETVAQYSPVNLAQATKGVANSYWRIQGMMNQFHANSIQRLLYLHKRLVNILSPKEYFQLIIQPFLQKIRKRILPKG